MKFSEFRKLKKPTRAKPFQHESMLQRECVQWFRVVFPMYLIFSVPNGGSRNKLEAKRMKDEGVLAGVADLVILKNGIRSGALFIEMKHGANRQSIAQKEFEKYCIANDYQYNVCKSLEEFQTITEKYLLPF